MTQKALQAFPAHDDEHPLCWQVQPYNPVEGRGSTDVGDVSWVCPTAQAHGAAMAVGTPNHSWQQVAQGKTDFAHKSTRYISKILGQTGIALLEDPELLEKAKAEHRQLVGPDGYECPIPKGVRPRSLSSLKK